MTDMTPSGTPFDLIQLMNFVIVTQVLVQPPNAFCVHIVGRDTLVHICLLWHSAWIYTRVKGAEGYNGLYNTMEHEGCQCH